MRLIDLDKADAEQIPCGYLDHTSLGDVKEWLAGLPTVSPESFVKRGRWLINPDGYYPYCSECHAEPKSGIMTKFCPTCGAKMDLGVD